MLATLLAQKQFVHFVVPLCHCFGTAYGCKNWIIMLESVFTVVSACLDSVDVPITSLQGFPLLL